MAERRENITELRRQVAQLEKVKPDANGRYKYANRVFTKTAWEEYVGEFKNRLSRLEGTAQIRGEETGRANQQAINAEISAANKKRAEINEYLTDFVQAFNKARSVEEEDALRVWRDYYQNEVNKLNKYVDDLQAGRVFVGAIDLDTPFQKYQPEQVTPRPSAAQQSATATPTTTTTPDISTIKTKDQASTEIQNTRARINKLRGLIGERQSNGVVLYFEAPGVQPGMTAMQRDAIIASSEARIAALNTKFFAETPAAGQATTSPAGTPAGAVTSPTGTPFTPGAGESVFGGTFVQPGTMLPGATPLPDLSGVNFSAETPTTPPSTTTPVGVTPSGGGMGAQPTGPSYTDPATQVTYQPGQQIGGEDRALPNGGAVVDGIYIPPGIDYAALGTAMQVPEEWEKAAREMFGVWYDVFKNDPEMSAFIQRLMREPEMSDEMFMAELQKTNWWRTTNATARDYARRQIEDPATLGTEIQNQKAQLRQLALDRGFTVNEAALDDAALKMVQFGFSQQIALNHLGQLTLEAAQGPSGLVRGYYGQSIREISAQFGVPLSETTLTKWAGDLATGNQTLASFEAYARDLAKNLYPTLSGGFDRGLSFGQMTDPYAQVASRILEIPATQVDFTDPKWAQAFTMKNEKGEQVPMSFGEWSDYLRTNPSFGYEYTDEAVNKAYSVVNQLAELFGRA